jgi:hypothetical protein
MNDLEWFDVVIVDETRLAIRVDEGDREIWLPKSMIESLGNGKTEYPIGELIEIGVPVWMAEEKGLI